MGLIMDDEVGVRIQKRSAAVEVQVLRCVGIVDAGQVERGVEHCDAGLVGLVALAVVLALELARAAVPVGARGVRDGLLGEDEALVVASAPGAGGVSLVG